MRGPKDRIPRSRRQALAVLGGVLIGVLIWLFATSTGSEEGLEVSGVAKQLTAVVTPDGSPEHEAREDGPGPLRAEESTPRVGLGTFDQKRELTIRIIDGETGRGFPGITFSLDAGRVGEIGDLTTDAAGEARVEIPLVARRVAVGNWHQLLTTDRVLPWLGGGYEGLPPEGPALIEIQCVAPWAVLDVRLNLPERLQGAARGEVRVRVSTGHPCHDGFSPGQVSSDRALLSFHCPPTEEACEVVLQASGLDGTLHSRCTPLTIAPGWNRASLELGEAPTLRVFVQDEQGAPLRKCSLWCSSSPGPWYESLHHPEDLPLRNGESAWAFVVHPPFDTPIRYSVSDDRTYWNVLAGTLQLEAGEKRDLHLRLPEEGAPVLLAEGRVLDEHGAGLLDQEVLLRFEAGGELQGSTDAGGHFEIHGLGEARRGSLRVSPYSDSLFPPARDLALPATDIVLQRTRPPETRRISIAIRDARDGRIIEDAGLEVHAREEGNRWRLLTCLLDAEGTFEIPYEPDLSLFWSAMSFDHESETGALLPEHLREDPALLEIELHPGLLVKYRVVDERTGRGIAGAIARDREGDPLGRSDPDGVIEVRAAGYLEDITVVASGYLDGFIAPYAMNRWMGNIPLRREVPSGVVETR